MNKEKFFKLNNKLWKSKKGNVSDVELAEMVYLETLKEIQDEYDSKHFSIYIESKNREWKDG